jgi:hypothetical protein
MDDDDCTKQEAVADFEDDDEPAAVAISASRSR